MRPTREGRHSPFRPGLVFRGIGVDPEVPTEDPPDPTDRAADGQASVPFLPPPEAGTTEDFNLSFGTDSDGGGDRAVIDPTFANDGDIDTYAGRNSFFSGGTNSWWLEADLGSALEVTEIVVIGGKGNAAEGDPVWDIEHSDDGSSWATAVGTYVWTPGVGSVPARATLTLTASATKRYWRIGETVGAGFAYPLKVYTWQINGPSTSSDPTNVIWVDAPLTVDGDNATYDYAYDTGITQFWRIDLGDSYYIASMTARLAFETAQSNPIIVQGANQVDYSDAVTVATIAVTATGSFTAQDIVGSWTPTAVYRYWQLVQTTEDDIRVHEVTLLDPPDFTGVHSELTGRSETDQHPASAVTVSPAVNGETDVQGALEDHETRIDTLEAASSGPDVTLVEVAAAGATETVDVSVARTYDLTLTDDLTLTLSGATDNEAHYVTVAFRQDGTGGWEVTHPGSVTWLGSEPTIDPDPAAVTWVTYLSLDGGTVWYGFPIGGAGGGVTDHDSLTGVSADDHHNQAHALVGADHTASGLTTGHVLTATGATSFAFAAATAATRWEVVMTGTGAGLEPVTNDAEDDWLYAEV